MTLGVLPGNACMTGEDAVETTAADTAMHMAARQVQGD